MKKDDAGAAWGLLGIGSLLLIIGLFFDPIGSSPDTGLIDASPQTLKMILGGIGALMFIAGVVALFSGSDKSK